MQYRKLAWIIGSIGSLAAGAAHANNSLAQPSVHGPWAPIPAAVAGTPAFLYDQTDSCSTDGINSQIFDSANSQYDSAAADDFEVPEGQTWDVTYLSFGGQYYDGTGPATAIAVTFYSDFDDKPGAEVMGCDYPSITTFSDAAGAFAVNLPSTCHLRADANVDTHFWVSVRAIMDSTIGGRWAWNPYTTTQFDTARWQNPPNGYGSGCTVWADLATCAPGAGPDLCYAVAGSSEPNAGDDGIFDDTFDVGTIAENFDEVTAPALPTEWSSTADAGNPWITSTSDAYDAPNSAYADDPSSLSDKSLYSKLFIESGSGQFSFQQDVELEPNYDGAVLEISINGSAYDDIINAGGSFSAGGYNDTISECCGSALAGRPAWTGSSGGYMFVEGSLPSSAIGQTVKLRWRVASDTSVDSLGYWLDSIKVD